MTTNDTHPVLKALGPVQDYLDMATERLDADDVEAARGLIAEAQTRIRWWFDGIEQSRAEWESRTAA